VSQKLLLVWARAAWTVCLQAIAWDDACTGVVVLRTTGHLLIPAAQAPCKRFGVVPLPAGMLHWEFGAQPWPSLVWPYLGLLVCTHIM
jgi:hypothetical protein